MDITATAQRITFGLYLDGQRGAPPSDSVGEAVVGPLGLLGILETQLGCTDILSHVYGSTISTEQQLVIQPLCREIGPHRAILLLIEDAFLCKYSA